PLGDNELGDVEITASSADENVVTDDDITVELNEDNSFTLSATPSATGTTFLNLVATSGDDVIAESTMGYWVSEPLPLLTSVWQMPQPHRRPARTISSWLTTIPTTSDSTVQPSTNRSPNSRSTRLSIRFSRAGNGTSKPRPAPMTSSTGWA